MQHQTLQIEAARSNRLTTKRNSLRSRSDEVLIALATLGLAATIADEEADYLEIDTFTLEFRRRFALSKRQSLRLIGLALKRVRIANGTEAIDCACDTLNEHLDPSQKLELFEALSDVLVADGRIHESEEYFLDYIVGKLNLFQSLEKHYPIAQAKAPADKRGS